jgi:hypothetical protein
MFENIPRTLCNISYGRLHVYHHAIENQYIWYGVCYHLAIKNHILEKLDVPDFSYQRFWFTTDAAAESSSTEQNSCTSAKTGGSGMLNRIFWYFCKKKKGCSSITNRRFRYC